MKKISTLIMLCLLAISAVLATGAAFPTRQNESLPLPATQNQTSGRVVVANRAAGSLSIIDAATDTVVDTVSLPAGTNPPEPMYVVYMARYNRVFVGDRANNRVVAFNATDFSVDGTVPAGNGVFHMWGHAKRRQLWVNNDIDNTASVIDPKTLTNIVTVPMPADLVAMGGKPHDVILDKQSAFVTMVGLTGPDHYVVKFNRRTFREVARRAVGKDPHVILTQKNNRLYVASQDADTIFVLKRRNLDQVATIPVPGAHGVWIPRHAKVLYATNLPGGGIDGLYTIDLKKNLTVGSPADTAYPVPHNLVASQDSKKLYVTHSGATADKVTVYAISRQNPVPAPLGEITVGLNPFGLAFVPDAIQEDDEGDDG